jgi:hypothetical protein
MNLPPVPSMKFAWYQHEREQIEEYGRQCWNAAIEAAMARIDYIGASPKELSEMLIHANTVSPTE